MSQDKSILEYYEKSYKSNTREFKNNLKRIKNNFKHFDIEKDCTILDVGCGFGTVMYYLATQGAKVTGIDISHQAAKISSQGESRALQASAQELPFATGCFDKAVFMGTLEHFPDPIKAIKEAKRVLKPSASVCFIVPNSKFPLFKFMGGTGQIYEVPHTLQEWSDMFTANGYEVKRIYRDSGPGFFDRGILGISKKLILIFFNLLPVQFTYQFVFICRKA